MSREIGTAFAVLAIYLLTVLGPLHHARASQLAFEELGYSTLQSSWALCTPAGVGGDQDRDTIVAKCPAAGAGKTELALPAPHVASVAHDRVALAAPLFTVLPSFLPRLVTPPGGSRAPPVQV